MTSRFFQDKFKKQPAKQTVISETAAETEAKSGDEGSPAGETKSAEEGETTSAEEGETKSAEEGETKSAEEEKPAGDDTFFDAENESAIPAEYQGDAAAAAPKPKPEGVADQLKKRVGKKGTKKEKRGSKRLSSGDAESKADQE